MAPARTVRQAPAARGRLVSASEGRAAYGSALTLKSPRNQDLTGVRDEIAMKQRTFKVWRREQFEARR